MLKKLSVLLFLSLILNGCFIADEYLTPPQPAKEKSLQEKSQNAVSKYIKKNSIAEKYEPYGFGEIIITKPIQLVEVEKLKSSQKLYPDSTELKQKIDSLEKIIRKRNIERTINLEHFFTLSDSSGNLQIFETRFILNDTIGVKDMKPQIILSTTTEYRDVLLYYFYEYTIFLEDTYSESKKTSKEFYDFFKEHLETLTSVDAKSNFLKHTLELCAYVKKNGAFDQQIILEGMVKQYILKKRKDITDYQPLQFSPLYENSEEDGELKKDQSYYYFFHKFIGSYENNTDTNVVLIEFSKYYEIDQIYQMEKPFDPYFNN